LSDNWKDPSNHALFVSEIATISLLGRQDDVDFLEHLLETASNEDLQRELIQLADKIRNRHNMGLRKDCCDQCLRFETCELKWLKTERSMRPTCCPRCEHFEKCLKSHLQEKHIGRREDD
jgi:hypothetical protein